MSDLNFENRTVLVTGGAGGFGSQTCREFGALGANVVVADLNLAKAQTVADELGSAIAIMMDVTDEESIKAGIQTAVDTFGGLDVLVNNAGAPNLAGPYENTTLKDMDWLYQINYRSTALASQHALLHLRKSPIGNIVNVASVSAKRPRPGSAIYCSLKAGVEALTRALAVEFAPDIRVNAVSPVIAETGFVKNAMGTDTIPDDTKAAMVSGIPMGRPADVRDVANSIVFLASEMASFLTGSIIDVDGGRSIS